MMHSFLTYVFYDFKRLFKNKGGLWGIFLLPLLLFFILFYGLLPALSPNFIPKFELLMLDRENSTETRFLISQLRQTRIFENIRVTYDETQVNRFVEEEYPAIVIIPENYTAKTATGENPPIEVLGNPNSPTQALLVKNLVANAASFVTSGQSALNIYFAVSKELGVPVDDLNETFEQKILNTLFLVMSRLNIFEDVSLQGLSQVPITVYVACAILGLFIGFSTLPVMSLFSEEQSQRMWARYKSAKISTFSNLLSKFIISLALIFAQLLVLLFFAQLTGIKSPFSFTFYGSFIALLLVATFAFSGFAAFFSSFYSERFNPSFVGALILFFLALIGGCIFPLHLLPEIVAHIGKFSLFHHLLMAFIAHFTQSTSTLYIHLLFLLLWGTLFYLGGSIALSKRRS